MLPITPPIPIPITQQEKDEKKEKEEIEIEIIKKAPTVTTAAVSENHQRQSRDVEVYDNRICSVCLDAEKNVVFLPCSHMAVCSSCTANIELCPICRQEIKYYIKPIIS